MGKSSFGMMAQFIDRKEKSFISFNDDLTHVLILEVNRFWSREARPKTKQETSPHKRNKGYKPNNVSLTEYNLDKSSY